MHLASARIVLTARSDHADATYFILILDTQLRSRRGADLDFRHSFGRKCDPISSGNEARRIHTMVRQDCLLRSNDHGSSDTYRGDIYKVRTHEHAGSKPRPQGYKLPHKTRPNNEALRPSAWQASRSEITSTRPEYLSTDAAWIADIEWVYSNGAEARDTEWFTQCDARQPVTKNGCSKLPTLVTPYHRSGSVRSKWANAGSVTGGNGRSIAAPYDETLIASPKVRGTADRIGHRGFIAARRSSA